MSAPAGTASRRFQLVLIKPSHYDDDGYVIQWVRAFIPSNSLAALYGLAQDAAQRAVLGPDTAIDITVIDEVNTRVRTGKLLSLLRPTAGLAWLPSPACNRTSSRARSTSRVRSAPPACR